MLWAIKNQSSGFIRRQLVSEFKWRLKENGKQGEMSAGCLIYEYCMTTYLLNKAARKELQIYPCPIAVLTGYYYYYFHCFLLDTVNIYSIILSIHSHKEKEK